ncbi:unnamed protein product, partial [Didymodactylos carnosus]
VNVKPGTTTSKRNVTDDEQFVRVKDSREPSDMYGVSPPETGAKEQTRPSTPPTRSAAFEEFKQTRGSNLNKIYQENKDIMSTKKKQFAELARRINQTKGDIDKTRIDAERKKNERLNLGEFTNENGETIIDEEEYELISKLQELKAAYRVDFDNWKMLKSEIAYCQNLVNQCQQRLVQEFDSWYNDCYLPANEDKTSADVVGKSNEFQIYEDAAERFERMQKELLMSDLDSMPYRAAQMKTNRRHVFNSSISQPLYKNAPNVPNATGGGTSSSSNKRGGVGAPPQTVR